VLIPAVVTEPEKWQRCNGNVTVPSETAIGHRQSLNARGQGAKSMTSLLSAILAILDTSIYGASDFGVQTFGQRCHSIL
jgi:hypothetical protein